jgi:ABC-type amino acid transport system permease subunit
MSGVLSAQERGMSLTSKRQVAGALIGAIVAFLVVFASINLSAWVRASYSPWSFMAEDLWPIVAALGGGLLGFFLTVPTAVRQAKPKRRPKLHRTALTVLALAYLMTWTFGIPAATTFLLSEAVSEQASLIAYRKERGHEKPQYEPTLVTIRFAFAPLPGLVVVHAETHRAGTCDWCGWSVFAWVPGATKHLGTRWHWIT